MQGINYWILIYRKKEDEEVRIVGFCDADWAGDVDIRRFITGYVFMLFGGVILWNSRR